MCEYNDTSHLKIVERAAIGCTSILDALASYVFSMQIHMFHVHHLPRVPLGNSSIVECTSVVGSLLTIFDVIGVIGVQVPQTSIATPAPRHVVGQGLLRDGHSSRDGRVVLLVVAKTTSPRPHEGGNHSIFNQRGRGQKPGQKKNSGVGGRNTTIESANGVGQSHGGHLSCLRTCLGESHPRPRRW